MNVSPAIRRFRVGLVTWRQFVPDIASYKYYRSSSKTRHNRSPEWKPRWCIWRIHCPLFIDPSTSAEWSIWTRYCFWYMDFIANLMRSLSTHWRSWVTIVCPLGVVVNWSLLLFSNRYAQYPAPKTKDYIIIIFALYIVIRLFIIFYSCPFL